MGDCSGVLLVDQVLSTPAGKVPEPSVGATQVYIHAQP